MDSTVNADPHGHAHRHTHRHTRLAAVRSVRSWRAGHSWPARALTLIVPIAAFLAWCFLALGGAQARVQIDFDPMRPAPAASIAAPGASAVPGADAAPAAPAVPLLRITRMTGPAGTLSALVDDTWVRRGDVVAGYRVLGLRTESIDLVSLADPTQRLTLRLNPVSVERNDSRGDKPKAPQAWPPLALEKKP